MTEKKRVVIFSLIESERLKYVLDTIFFERLKVDFILTNDLNIIEESDYVLEYNFRKSTNFDFIQSNEIIENHFLDKNFQPNVIGTGEDLLLFPNSDSLLEMDIFSSIFYCLSHYDAYCQTQFDVHQRIIFSHWVPRKLGLDRLPYIEIWLEKLKLYLQIKGITCSHSIFKQDISFDIDHFYLFDQRPFFQHIKASIGDIIKGKFFQLFQRWLVILGLTEDPAEKFFHFLDYQKNENFSFFILMKHGKNNSLNPLNDLKKLLIKKLKRFGEIGIHPSYDSSFKKGFINKEKMELQIISEQYISKSRFHFLRVSFPSSFYQLIDTGIKVDKSIGYYDLPGFLSSTSIPYFFFDPTLNKKTELLIQPFMWMDSMNKYYRKLDEEEEKRELHEIKRIVKKYNGIFSVVFHNDSMIDRRYRVLFKSLLYN
ncbi:MAG: hypothetical protein LC105_09690 [Chitinophagales bacterium]|nr:hypothetical protein [Chitinophagales bacterium]MCZ2394117.1 hypothetical protein [Chitinophagales bacterium]